MPYRLPGDDASRWRGLDSQAWSLVALGCTLYLPHVGRTWLGELSLLYVGPVVWGLFSILALGEPAGLVGPWQPWRLRASWLTFAGLAPFVSGGCPVRRARAVGAGYAQCLLPSPGDNALVSRLARSRLAGPILDALLAASACIPPRNPDCLPLVTFGVALLVG